WAQGTFDDGSAPAVCPNSSFVCQDPVVDSTTYSVAPGCDPKLTSCSITATVNIHFPGNHRNSSFFGFGYSFELVELLNGGSVAAECGQAGGELRADFGTATVTSSAQCGLSSTKTLSITSCPQCPPCGTSPV